MKNSSDNFIHTPETPRPERAKAKTNPQRAKAPRKPPIAEEKMEVEVKLRLPDSYAHQSVLKVLSPFHTETHLQENLFFDGPRLELASNFTALRIRFYNDDTRCCVLSLKSKPNISGGVSRIEEVEHPLDPLLGRACVSDPTRLAQLARPNRVIDRLEELGLAHVSLVCIGGFKNVRNVHVWKGLTVEVDETLYEFGTCYEVECETDNPPQAKGLIEDLLHRNGIQYSYSNDNKFAVFMSGKLP